ncbi:MAG TPA: hydantoinase/oxoprolinase family protein [Candidatus Methylomirabilis sp.]|nr:hydantoinase/oxoprolinase family protein [Candidatus Methylomirabilis sp.]
MASCRVGIDIGGTFTDAAFADERTGRLRVVKVPTTPAEPARGFLSALERGLAEEGAGGEALALVVHATTVATNAIIEGKTARVGMLITEGFRDVLEIGRQIRSRLYDVHLSKPRPLIPRRWSLGVSERLDSDGRVLVPLDEEQVRRAVRALAAEGVEALVICLLHSYLNPAHERAAAAIAREEAPGLFLSVSCEVCPEFREYLRASTAAVNAAVTPLVTRYLGALESELGRIGVGAPFYVMQSSGGVMTARSAKERPVYMLESGPAAGVIVASALGSAAGHPDVISFDMGGTTAKVGLVREARPRLAPEFEVGAQAISPLGEGRGGGYPVRTPVIDLVEVGAGGGSEAWIDAGGGLRVGPRSAGAVPGPACYGQGGAVPTITDANLLLGRLNPEFFLGGEIRLDPEAGRGAVSRVIGAPLRMDPVVAAAGIIEIANAHMIAAMRLVSVQRGYDPREFVLVAFGGAGPLHANALAAELRVRTVLIPPSPGIASALGLLLTDIRHDLVATRRQRLDATSPDALNAVFADFAAQAGSALDRDGVPAARRRIERSVDLRYHGQSHELAVPVPAEPLDAAALGQIRRAFDEAHARAYGYAAAEDAVELVNVRLTGVGLTPPLTRPELAVGERDATAAVKGARPVWFRETSGFADCAVVDRSRLLAGNVVAGPAVVEEMDATSVIHPGWEAAVDPHGNLLLRPC